jgi:hypothetical protein
MTQIKEAVQTLECLSITLDDIPGMTVTLMREFDVIFQLPTVQQLVKHSAKDLSSSLEQCLVVPCDSE